METRKNNKNSVRNKRKLPTEGPTTSRRDVKKKKPLQLSFTKKQVTAGQSKSSDKLKKRGKQLSEKSNKQQSEDLKSFRKYGVILPKFKDVLADIKKIDEYEKTFERLENLKNFDINQRYDFRKIRIDPKPSKKSLDCKHLTKYEIKESFTKYKAILSDILNGKKRCQRHELFYKRNKNLIYNTSMIVFNSEQKVQMLSLMDETFDNSTNNLTNYFLQVLLPELCLLIFKDTHRMTKKEAEKYLADRPVESS